MKKIFSIIAGLICVLAFQHIGQGQSLKDIINGQLNSLGLPYVADNVVDVNQALGLVGGQVTDGEMSDPYGTLNGCLLFAAYNPSVQESDTACMFIIGISKNGNIIWRTDDSILCGYCGAEIYETIDLNLDGDVDLIWELKLRGDNSDWTHLIILSWDGSVCTNITTDSTDSQTDWPGIFGRAQSYDFSDLDGDGIMEIRSHPGPDDDTVNIPTWSWNGQEYGHWTNTPNVPFTSWLPAKNAFADVYCMVVKEDTTYRYQYTVKNRSTSIRRIKNIHFVVGAPTVGYTIGSWHASGGDFFRIVSWDMIGLNYTNMIRPGEQKIDFVATSKGLPKINTYYVQSERGREDNVDFDLNDLRNDIINNSNSGTTISPDTVPNPFSPLNFLDTLTSYTTQSRTLGWITEQTAAEKYTTLFDSAKVQLQRNAIRITRATLDTVLANANGDSSSTLSSEAYALLYFNTEYLLNQLPIPPPQYNLNTIVIGNGTVTKSPELALYDSATTVSLTANPSTGYRFGSWSGDAVGTISPISVIMNSNKNITATFLQNTFIITATAGTNGTITPSGDVSVTYGANQSFAITPNTGYHITDVIVDQTSVGAVATYTFTNVTAPHTISSTFAINTYTLTVNAINGTVSKSPDQQTYNHGTSVQLTATPNTGYSFVNWTGDLIGTTNPVTVLMTSNKNITANFALNPPTITSFTPANGPIGTTVTITGTNFISVTSVKFNGTTASYTVNSSTQITATVPTGATTGSITVTNTAGTATSSTTFKVGYILTIQIAGSGTVLKNPNYLSYTPGTTVTLTAKPTLIEALKIVPNTPEPISWKFDHWEIDLTGTQNPKSIIMNGNKTVKAVFVPVY